MNVVFGNCGSLHFACLLAHSPNSVAGRFLPCLSFFLHSQISLAPLFKHIPTRWRQIHFAVSILPNGTQLSNVSKKICNRHLPVQGSICMLFQSVPPQDNGLMLFLEKPSHTSIFPLVAHTIVGLPNPFGQLLQGEIGLLQADCGFTLCTTQVRRIVALIICIIIVTCIIIIVRNLWEYGQVCNPCDICLPQFHRQQESFRWQANGRSPMCTRRRSRWMSTAGRYWPINWIVSLQSWRHSQGS